MKIDGWTCTHCIHRTQAWFKCILSPKIDHYWHLYHFFGSFVQIFLSTSCFQNGIIRHSLIKWCKTEFIPLLYSIVFKILLSAFVSNFFMQNYWYLDRWPSGYIYNLVPSKQMVYVSIWMGDRLGIYCILYIVIIGSLSTSSIPSLAVPRNWLKNSPDSEQLY